MHGYISRKLEDNNNIGRKSSLSWACDRYITSHLEGYAFAIQEQEIATKYLINKRDKDASKPPRCDRKCRLCHTSVEDITHIISSCPKMSARYYLPMRHDIVAKTIYNAIRRKDCPDGHTQGTPEPECIHTFNIALTRLCLFPLP